MEQIIEKNITTFILYAPVQSRSGYGDHAREIARALIQLGEWDVRIMPCGWGNTPLTESVPDLEPLFINKLPARPAIWAMLTVPNEFKRIEGAVNIGITAGIETTLCDSSWIDGCNRMDFVITTSNHSKNVLTHTVWTRGAEELKTTVPVYVLFEGLKEEIWKKPAIKTELSRQLKQVKKNSLVFVGHWLHGEHRHDRKDVGGLIESYHKACAMVPEKNRVDLILKTSSGGFSVTDREQLKSRVNRISGPGRVHLLHGDLTEKEMQELYSHPNVGAFVTFTHGEGYGRPIQEAAACGLPVFAPNWSGQVDFLKAQHYPLIGKLEKLHPSTVWEGMLIADSQWFYVDIDHAAKQLAKYMMSPASHRSPKVKKLQKDIQTNYTWDKMCKKLHEILKKHINKKIITLTFDDNE